MEADIPIWRKPGYFYFALTRIATNCHQTLEPHRDRGRVGGRD